MKQSLFCGMRDGIPVCLGYIIVSMSFGMFAVAHGIPVFSTIAFSMTNIVGNGRSQSVAKAVTDACCQLGVPVSASGVETRDQLNVLKELGCSCVQGSLFNKPITIDTFEVRYLKG
jgi:predicted signal transduction protein with EAL and GGDEF domain